MIGAIKFGATFDQVSAKYGCQKRTVKLINSMPRRIMQCIRKRGGPTSYKTQFVDIIVFYYT